MMDAIVTVKCKIRNCGDDEDIAGAWESWEAMVRWLIQEEGLVSLIENEYEILTVCKASE